MRKCCLFLIIYIIIFWPFPLEFLNSSVRRVKSPISASEAVVVYTSRGEHISYTCKHFPDGEIYIRIQNPAEIKNQDIKLYFHPHNREDFLRLLFLASTIAEYEPKSIEVEFQNWSPANLSEESILSALAHFADSIRLPEEVSFSFYTRRSIPVVTAFERIIYLDSRFQEYARKLGEEFNAEVVRVNTSIENSTHWEMEIPGKVKGKDVLVIHSTSTADDILNLISTLYLLKKMGARSITVVNTYQGYARQDKIFKPGEGVIGYALLKVLNALSDYNIAINVHFGEKSGEVQLKNEEVYNLNGFKYLARGVFDHILGDYSPEELRNKTLCLLAPDDGSYDYVKEAVQDMKEYLSQKGINMRVVAGYLNKIRISSQRVVIKNNILGEGGKELDIPQDAFFIILDDETSTGMTVKVATYHLVNVLGFNWWHIYAGVVHGKFVEGMRRFFTEGEDHIPPRFIAALDTLQIPERIKVISIYPLLLNSLKEFLNSTPLPLPQ